MENKALDVAGNQEARRCQPKYAFAGGRRSKSEYKTDSAAGGITEASGIIE